MLFGRDSVAVELTHHGYPDDDERNDALAVLAAQFGLPVVATGNVHYARLSGYRVAQHPGLAGWIPGRFGQARPIWVGDCAISPTLKSAHTQGSGRRWRQA